MSTGESSDRIECLRNQSVDYVLIGFSALGMVNYLFVLLNTFYYSFVTPVDFIIQTSATLTLVGITVFRKRFGARLKITIPAIIIFLVIATTLYSVGPFSNAIIYIAILPALVAMLFSIRRALTMFIIMGIIYLSAAFLYTKGIWSLRFDPMVYGTLGTNWIIGMMVVVYSAGGMLVVGFQFSKSLKEITTRLWLQNQQLEENEKKYHVLFESSNDGIFIMDKGRIIDCNTKTLKLFAGTKRDIIGKSPWELSPLNQPDGQYSEAKAQDYLSQALKNEDLVFDWLHKKQTGDLFHASVSLTAVDNGLSDQVQAVIRDITTEKLYEAELMHHQNILQQLVEEKSLELMKVNSELEGYNEEINSINEELLTQNDSLKNAVEELKSLQRQLIRSEQMASVGILTSGIAHEINNPINFINSGVYGLEQEIQILTQFLETIRNLPTQQNHEPWSRELEKLTTDENLAESLENLPILIQSIYKGVERTTKIVKGLRTFARSDSEIKHLVSLKEIIDSALIILHNRYYGSVKITTRFSADDIVHCFPGRLVQLFLNIIHAIIVFLKLPAGISIQTFTDAGSNQIFTNILFPRNTSPATLSILYVGGPFSEVNLQLGKTIIEGILAEHEGRISILPEANNHIGFNIALPKN